MTYYDWKKQYDALSARDKKIYDLARKAVNELGFAMQNMHSDRIVEKREMASDAAMKELFEVLIAGIVTPSNEVFKCPKCDQPLTEVKYPSDSPLNRDQWESQLAGDLFCACHNNHTGNKPYAYFWKSELKRQARLTSGMAKEPTK